MMRFVAGRAENNILFLTVFALAEVVSSWLYLRVARVSPFFSFVPFAGHIAMLREMARIKSPSVLGFEYAKWFVISLALAAAAIISTARREVSLMYWLLVSAYFAVKFFMSLALVARRLDRNAKPGL